MRRRRIVLMLSLAISFLAGGARGDVAFSLSGDQDGIKEFRLAIGDYYRVPETQVTVIRERQIPDEELPVVFFLAQRAKVSPDIIVNMRLGGKSWMDITYYYGMGADIYYVPVKTVNGPPYGKAYGYYKNRPKKEWKYIKLADDDVINLVDLRFISSHYGHPPDEVIKMRSDGKSFMAINKDFKENKGKHTIEKSEKSKSSKSSKGQKSSLKSKDKKRK